jgi:hypothetical protein
MASFPVEACLTSCSLFVLFMHLRTEMAMDDRINEIRRLVRALRERMREAEAVMHEQVGRDQDCTQTAEEIMRMRVVLSDLVRERTALGDNEPILVRSLFIPRRAPAAARPRVAKRRLVPHDVEHRRGHA